VPNVELKTQASSFCFAKKTKKTIWVFWFYFRRHNYDEGLAKLLQKEKEFFLCIEKDYMQFG